MRKFLFSAAMLFFACCTLTAQQTNTAFLKQIANARFVMVTAEHGDAFDPRTDAADRRAMGDIQNEMAKWHRFTLVNRKQDADIIIAVRTSGRVRANSGIEIGSHQDPTNGRRTTTTAPVLMVEAGPKNDLLSVYSASDFPNAPALWRSEQEDGLVAPSNLLFNRFKKDVEKAASQKP